MWHLTLDWCLYVTPYPRGEHPITETINLIFFLIGKTTRWLQGTTTMLMQQMSEANLVIFVSYGIFSWHVNRLTMAIRQTVNLIAASSVSFVHPGSMPWRSVWPSSLSCLFKSHKNFAKRRHQHFTINRC